MWGNYLYFVTPDDYFVSLDARTGKERWHKEIAPLQPAVLPDVGADGRSATTSSSGPATISIRPAICMSFDPETGEQQWTLLYRADEVRAIPGSRRGRVSTRRAMAAAIRGCRASTIRKRGSTSSAPATRRPRTRPSRAARGGQPLHVLDRRGERRHRQDGVVLPDVAARHARLGLGADAGARRRRVPRRRAAQDGADREPQRLLLHARSAHRRAPGDEQVLGHRQLGQGAVLGVTLVAWHGDGMETTCHVAVGDVQLRLAVLVLAIAAVSAVAARAMDRRSPGGRTRRMTSTSEPTENPYSTLPSVGPYPAEIGSALITMVEPHEGHDHAYNRWYEDDHFYSGAMAMPWMFAGPPLGGADARSRRCGTRTTRRSRSRSTRASTSRPTGSPTAATTTTCAGRVATNQRLLPDGRIYLDRTHVYTSFQTYRDVVYRDDDRPARRCTASTTRTRASWSRWSTHPRAATARARCGGCARSTCRPGMAGTPIAMTLLFAPNPLPPDHMSYVEDVPGIERRLTLLSLHRGDTRRVLGRVRRHRRRGRGRRSGAGGAGCAVLSDPPRHRHLRRPAPLEAPPHPNCGRTAAICAVQRRNFGDDVRPGRRPCRRRRRRRCRSCRRRGRPGGPSRRGSRAARSTRTRRPRSPRRWWPRTPRRGRTARRRWARRCRGGPRSRSRSGPGSTSFVSTPVPWRSMRIDSDQPQSANFDAQ